jgi:hypothetical protein
MQCLLQAFFENRFPPAGLPKPRQLQLRRHHDLRTCTSILGLEGTLHKSYFKGIWTELSVGASGGGGLLRTRQCVAHKLHILFFTLRKCLALRKNMQDIFKFGSGNVFFGEALVQTEATGTARS